MAVMSGHTHTLSLGRFTVVPKLITQQTALFTGNELGDGMAEDWFDVWGWIRKG